MKILEYKQVSKKIYKHKRKKNDNHVILFSVTYYHHKF